MTQLFLLERYIFHFIYEMYSYLKKGPTANKLLSCIIAILIDYQNHKPVLER